MFRLQIVSKLDFVFHSAVIQWNIVRFRYFLLSIKSTNANVSRKLNLVELIAISSNLIACNRVSALYKFFTDLMVDKRQTHIDGVFFFFLKS